MIKKLTLATIALGVIGLASCKKDSSDSSSSLSTSTLTSGLTSAQVASDAVSDNAMTDKIISTIENVADNQTTNLVASGLDNFSALGTDSSVDVAMPSNATTVTVGGKKCGKVSKEMSFSGKMKIDNNDTEEEAIERRGKVYTHYYIPTAQEVPATQNGKRQRPRHGDNFKFTAGAVNVIVFDNFKSGSVTINGIKTLTINSDIDLTTGTVSATEESNLTITFDAESSSGVALTATKKTKHNVLFIFASAEATEADIIAKTVPTMGNSTLPLIPERAWVIVTNSSDGTSGSGTTRYQEAYTSSIKKDLVKAPGIPYFISGVEVQTIGSSTRSIDFGDGTPDNIATVTATDSSTSEITLGDEFKPRQDKKRK